jgi:hypothetical protein
VRRIFRQQPAHCTGSGRSPWKAVQLLP